MISLYTKKDKIIEDLAAENQKLKQEIDCLTKENKKLKAELGDKSGKLHIISTQIMWTLALGVIAALYFIFH